MALDLFTLDGADRTIEDANAAARAGEARRPHFTPTTADPEEQAALDAAWAHGAEAQAARAGALARMRERVRDDRR